MCVCVMVGAHVGVVCMWHCVHVCGMAFVRYCVHFMLEALKQYAVAYVGWTQMAPVHI